MARGLSKSRDEIAAAYDSPAWWYDLRGFFILTFAYNSTLTHQLKFFGPALGARHLELACGSGTLLQMVLWWRRWKRLPSSQIVAVDYAESMLEGARRRFSGRPDIDVRLADAANLPFQDASFDTANVANAIHCFPDIDAALSELFRVLRPGGSAAVNVLLHPRGIWPFRQIAERIDRWGIRKGILVTPYHRDEVRARVRRVGFEVEGETISGNCYDLIARKPVRP